MRRKSDYTITYQHHPFIEGVNTSAENFCICRNRKSGSKSFLDIFTHKDVIGRCARMFKYFIGKIYLLESQPAEDATQLDIPFRNTVLGDLGEKVYSSSLDHDHLKTRCTSC